MMQDTRALGSVAARIAASLVAALPSFLAAAAPVSAQTPASEVTVSFHVSLAIPLDPFPAYEDVRFESP
jgi:hypothetical protein